VVVLCMGGIIGRLFREFAVTVSVAVLISAVVSLTLTPMMCSLLLRHEDERPKGRFNLAAERFFDWLVKGYDRGLRWVFRHRLITLLSTLVLIVATGWLYITIPKGFFPGQDTGCIVGQAEARQDISFEGMTKVERQLSDIILKDPAVAAVVGFVGATGGNAAENTARMMVQLKPFNERRATAQDVIQR